MPNTAFTHASLRAELALSFGSLAAVLAAGLSLGLASMLSSQIEASEGAALRAVSQTVATSLAEDLARHLHEVEVLAHSPSLWSAGISSDAVGSMIARLQAVDPDDSWIGVADESGVVRRATGGLLEGVDVRGRPWFEPGRLGPHISDVHSAKLLGDLLGPGVRGEPRRFVDFSAPIASGVSGAPRLGVFVVHGSFDWVERVVSKLAPADAATKRVETFVFDRSGKPIFAEGGHLARLEGSGQRMPPTAAPSAPAVVEWAGAGRFLTAVTRLPAASPQADLGWTIATREPEELAFALARRAARVAWAAGAAAALLAIGLAWVLAGRLSRPLAHISEAARAVAKGQAESIPAIGGSREVADLSDALVAMTDKLMSAKRGLEDRVRERTEELSAANAELGRLARIDPLTGLMNRRAFEERAEALAAAARRSGEPLSVVILDIDHFKRVNDTHGHPAGDAALVAIAAAMQARLREVDACARIGGEEFAVLLPGADASGASLVAESLVARVREMDVPVIGRVTVSCGAAEAAPSVAGVADALARADQALYRAKRDGRDRAAMAEPPSGPSCEARQATACAGATLEDGGARSGA